MRKYKNIGNDDQYLRKSYLSSQIDVMIHYTYTKIKYNIQKSR